MLKGIVSFILLLVVINNGYCEEKNDFRITSVYMPYYSAHADIDPNELNGGVLFDHDLKKGDAFGLKVSSITDHYRDTVVLSVAYYQGRQNERDNDEYVRSHTLYLEGGTEYNYRLSNDLTSYGAFLLGAGAVKFDFRKNQSQEWGGAFKGGLQLGVKIANKINVSIGGAYYLWGYPTETIGDGVFLAAELGVGF